MLLSAQPERREQTSCRLHVKAMAGHCLSINIAGRPGSLPQPQELRAAARDRLRDGSGPLLQCRKAQAARQWPDAVRRGPGCGQWRPGKSFQLWPGADKSGRQKAGPATGPALPKVRGLVPAGRNFRAEKPACRAGLPARPAKCRLFLKTVAHPCFPGSRPAKKCPGRDGKVHKMKPARYKSHAVAEQGGSGKHSGWPKALNYRAANPMSRWPCPLLAWANFPGEYRKEQFAAAFQAARARIRFARKNARFFCLGRFAFTAACRSFPCQ